MLRKAFLNFRLLPTLIITLTICVIWCRHLGDGPYWSLYYAKEVKYCLKNWWTNLLFLQTIINPNEMVNNYWVFIKTKKISLWQFLKGIINYRYRKYFDNCVWDESYTKSLRTKIFLICHWITYVLLIVLSCIFLWRFNCKLFAHWSLLIELAW